MISIPEETRQAIHDLLFNAGVRAYVVCVAGDGQDTAHWNSGIGYKLTLVVPLERAKMELLAGSK